jgi:hypothetical protein
MAKAAKKTKPVKRAPAGKPRTPKVAAPAPVARPPPVAPRPSRLGEDLLPAPARLTREPLSIVLAKTDIAGGRVNIKPLKVGPIRVARGQVVHVKHAYRLQEESAEREEYRFLLRSKVGGKEHPPSLARIGDQWGESEDISGYLQHEYVLDVPGTHQLSFEVGAEYTVMAWGETAVQAMDRKDMTGTIQVTVG